MSRALRRHPSKQAKQAKRARGAAPARPMRRTSTTHATPRAEGRSTLSAVASWRPQFLMDIINELRKVAWPNRQDTMHLTIVVVVVALIVGAVLGGIDIGFGWLIDNSLLR